MTQENYNLLKSRGTDNVPKNPFAVALGKLARGHKKTLTNAQREQRREQARALTPARLAKRAALASTIAQERL